MIFYYDNVPEPCKKIAKGCDGQIIAKHLKTGRIFEADEAKIDVRARYNPKVVEYIKKHDKRPTASKIAKECGITVRAVFYAIAAAKGEI